MIQKVEKPSVKDIFDPKYRRDYINHITAKPRNKLYNFHIFTKKVARLVTGKPVGSQEGYVKLRVRRALRNKRGIPIDKYGNEIDVNDQKALEERCVYPKDWYTIEDYKHNLLLTVGRDWIHAQLWTNTSAGTIGANFIGLTANASAPAAGDTVLTGEVNNTNGMGRKVATPITHTASATTSLLVSTWTASASGEASLQKAATFYHASTTTLIVLENTFTVTTLVSGDSLELSWTITTTN